MKVADFADFTWHPDEEALANGLEEAEIAKASYFDDCEAELRVWCESFMTTETVIQEDGRKVEETVKRRSWYIQLSVIGVRGGQRILWDNNGRCVFEESDAKKLVVNAYKQKYEAEAQSKDRLAESGDKEDADPHAIFPKWR